VALCVFDNSNMCLNCCRDHTVFERDPCLAKFEPRDCAALRSAAPSIVSFGQDPPKLYQNYNFNPDIPIDRRRCSLCVATGRMPRLRSRGFRSKSGLVAERTTTIQRRWRRSLVLEARPLSHHERMNLTWKAPSSSTPSTSLSSSRCSPRAWLNSSPRCLGWPRVQAGWPGRRSVPAARSRYAERLGGTTKSLEGKPRENRDQALSHSHAP